MKLRQTLLVSLLSMSSVAVADTLDIALSNSTAQFKYAVPGTLAGKSDVFGELMYNDANSMLGGAGLLVSNDQGNGFSLGVGAKAVASSIKIGTVRKSASALALGLQARFELPAEKRVSFTGEINYAPKIITFGDADQFQQMAVRAEYSISQQTSAYVGYRKTFFGLKNSNNVELVLANGPHVGIQLAF